MGKHEPIERAPLTFTLAPGMAPAAPLMRLLASFDRGKVEAFDVEMDNSSMELINYFITRRAAKKS